MAPAGFAGSVDDPHGDLDRARRGFARLRDRTPGGAMRWPCCSGGRRRPRSRLVLTCRGRGLWLLPLRDALSFAVFLVASAAAGYRGGDQLFRVAPDGRMTASREDKPA